MGGVHEKTIRDRQVSYPRVLCRQEMMDLLKWILDATITLNITVGLFFTNMDIFYFKMLKLLLSKTASCSEFRNLLCDKDFFLFALDSSLAGRIRKKPPKKGFNLCS